MMAPIFIGGRPSEYEERMIKQTDNEIQALFELVFCMETESIGISLEMKHGCVSFHLALFMKVVRHKRTSRRRFTFIKRNNYKCIG